MIEFLIPILVGSGSALFRNYAKKVEDDAKKEAALDAISRQMDAKPTNYTQIFGGVFSPYPTSGPPNQKPKSPPRETPHPPATPYTKTVAVKCRLPECPAQKDPSTPDGYCPTHARYLAEWLKKP